jgi:hypothetical protein
MKRLAYPLLLLAFVGSSVNAQDSIPTITTTVCEITRNPGAFLKKRVRIAVQHVADQQGQTAVADMPMVDNKRSTIKIDEPPIISYDLPGRTVFDPCLAAYELNPSLVGHSPFDSDRIPVHIGLTRRFPHVTYWGTLTTIVGTVHLIPAPEPKPDFVRDESGKIVEVNVWQNRTLNKPTLRVKVEIEGFENY